LGDVPTRLLLEVKTHIDNVVRELTLVGGRGHTRGSELPPDLAALVRTVVEEVAEARFELKRLAEEAAARGDDLTEVTLRVPASYAEAGERYIEALEEADRYARAARLLTMASPPSHRVFREWYVRSIVHQLEALTSGRRPDPPQPLAAVLARRLDELGTQLLRSPPD
jgi:hypothetical protein